MRERYLIRNSETAWRVYDGTAVILLAEDSTLNTLNAVGTLIWEAADGKTVRLFWLPASDNVTHPENIVYDVYSSLTQHREDFNKPPRATSAPGAASIAIQEVNAATSYFYVVRARDVAGNSDQNNVEGHAQTAPQSPREMKRGGPAALPFPR